VRIILKNNISSYQKPCISEINPQFLVFVDVKCAENGEILNIHQKTLNLHMELRTLIVLRGKMSVP